MVLMIDNYDSFTYNIVQYCLELGADLKVIRNDELSIEEIEALHPEKIIISPVSDSFSQLQNQQETLQISFLFY